MRDRDRDRDEDERSKTTPPSISPLYLCTLSLHSPKSSRKELLLWLLRRRRRFRVVGESMLPILRAGDEVLLDEHAYDSAAPQAGEIVVAYHPEQPDLKIIKRVGVVLANGLFLISDNSSAGNDSRQFGVVKMEKIVGRVNGRF